MHQKNEVCKFQSSKEKINGLKERNKTFKQFKRKNEQRRIRKRTNRKHKTRW